MTAEDPVEFNLPGINQVQMKEQIGLNFAAALRSFLRQDPNIILVGEIRDFETAEIAIKAALTGHLVLSTLHTNDAPSTISRLMNMGIEPFLVATSRQPHSGAAPHPPHLQGLQGGTSRCRPKRSSKSASRRTRRKQLKTYKGAGCKTCNNTGYKGRVGLYEVMEVTDEIRELILIGASALELRKRAIEDGMITLRESGLAKDQKRHHHARRGRAGNGGIKVMNRLRVATCFLCSCSRLSRARCPSLTRSRKWSRRSAVSRHKRYKRHSRAWWRRHRALMRARRERVAQRRREREMRLAAAAGNGSLAALRYANAPANSVNLSLLTFDAPPSAPAFVAPASFARGGSPNAAANVAPQRLRGPDRPPRRMPFDFNVPSNWSPAKRARPGEAVYTVLAPDGRAAGTAVLAPVSLVRDAGSGRAYDRQDQVRRRRARHGAAPHGHRPDGRRRRLGHERHRAASRTAGASSSCSRRPARPARPRSSWTFYFTEIDGRVYSLATNAPVRVRRTRSPRGPRAVRSRDAANRAASKHTSASADGRPSAPNPTRQRRNRHTWQVNEQTQEPLSLSDLLKKLIEMGGSDLHLTTNTPPQVRVDGHLRPARRLSLPHLRRHQVARLQRAHRRAEAPLRGEPRTRLLLRRARPLALPRQPLQPARRGRRGLPRDSLRDKIVRRPRPPAGRLETLRQARAA